MNPSHSIGVISGLTSAVVWGTGDFVGGLAARRTSQFGVVALVALTGLGIMIPAAFLAGEPFPSGATIAWSLAAGFLGAAGVAALYQGLSTGAAALVAPTSAVVAAALPVIAGSFLEGMPPSSDLAGIVSGLVGIWLVSRVPAGQGAAGRSGLFLGLIAGAGFGAFFILIAQVEDDVLFTPLVFTKLAGLIFGLAVLMLQRQRFPSLRRNPLGLLSGVLDAGGNLFFLMATQATTLAVAAVLASMYPAVTVGLSALVLHERIRRVQVAGVLLCLVAVAMISL